MKTCVRHNELSGFAGTSIQQICSGGKAIDNTNGKAQTQPYRFDEKCKRTKDGYLCHGWRVECQQMS